MGVKTYISLRGLYEPRGRFLAFPICIKGENEGAIGAVESAGDLGDPVLWSPEEVEG